MPRPTTKAAAIALCFAVPGGAVAQSAPETPIFQCTLNAAENRVLVLITGDSLTYTYSDKRGRVELMLATPLDAMSYEPFGWDGGPIEERVTFRNGDTAYTVFTTLAEPFGIAQGGIVVTPPSGAPTTLPCDAGTVAPPHPVAGIGRLAGYDAAYHDPFRRCLSRSPRKTACLGVATAQCQAMFADGSGDPGCLQHEQQRWEDELQLVVETALDAAQVAPSADGERLSQAQSHWAASRSADCDLAAWTAFNPFDGEAGKLQCLSRYAAERIDFLERHIAGLEFDG